ncbi:MAG: efflux RND transporter periplasmic adaptor subunit [Pseudomonadales bacterium]|jgi:RND family efflux transporter MFP subunit|nr:efflux RND transporter periplasmic adaptor subunit [Pseudomonadales bacterium]
MTRRILLLGLAALCLAAHVQAAPIALAPEEARRLGVETVPVQNASRIIIADQPGMVRVPNDRVRVLAAPANAVLTRLWVAEGQTVVAGDRLAELSGADVAALEADFRDAVGERELAVADRDRAGGLVEDGVLPPRALAEAEVRVRHAAGMVDGTRAALQTAGVGADRIEALAAGAAPRAALVLRAETDGSVLRQYVLPGEHLAAGDPILELGRLDQLWVEVHVPLDRIRGFEAGDLARIHAAPGDLIDGRVLGLGRRVHEADRGLLVRVLVDDPEGRLIPGQPVQVDLERPAPDGAFEVPASALVMFGAERALFLRGNGGFERITVEVVAQREDALVVRGALPADAVVAFRGTASLKALVDRGDG